MASKVLAIVVMAFMSACSGVGLIATDNPAVKISQAAAMANQGRSAQAQRLLKEAMAIYQQRGDNVGLGEAHRQFGFLARAGQGREGLLLVKDARSVVPKREDWELSQQHMRQALDLFSRADRPDLASNVYLLLGTGSFYLGEREQACAYLDQSLAANQQWETAHPDKKVELPSSVKNFAELIAKRKSDVGCGA